MDDQTTARHGRIGKDHVEYEHLALQAPVIEDVRRQLVTRLQEGCSAVLDRGLGTHAVRNDYRQLATEYGARWRLVHFQADHDELLRRPAEWSNEQEHGVVSPETLAWIAEYSEKPYLNRT
ncbi:AAA family ATPase [Streptomyces sp. NPDC056308]|uniref:AAA family ATPase n=1 Tax=Streptomyces sp. NPDC056308 TaxID=3345780 RepID=UPI0035DE0C55